MEKVLFHVFIYNDTQCVQQTNAFIRSNLNRKFSVKGFHTLYGWGVEVEPLLGLFWKIFAIFWERTLLTKIFVFSFRLFRNNLEQLLFSNITFLCVTNPSNLKLFLDNV